MCPKYHPSWPKKRQDVASLSLYLRPPLGTHLFREGFDWLNDSTMHYSTREAQEECAVRPVVPAPGVFGAKTSACPAGLLWRSGLQSITDLEGPGLGSCAWRTLLTLFMPFPLNLPIGSYWMRVVLVWFPVAVANTVTKSNSCWKGFILSYSLYSITEGS